MRSISFKNLCLLGICLISFSAISSAQAGSLVINQDPEIPVLLELKKEINQNGEGTDQYKINIFSGNLAKAETIKNDFGVLFKAWKSKLVYETPNYKIYVGSFRTRLQADRALLKIQKKFPHAFIFQPKSK